jgi:hypothetical protein
MSKMRLVRAGFAAGVLLLSVAASSPAGATILGDVDYMAGELGQNEYNKSFAYQVANPGLCQSAGAWTSDWKWYCTSDYGSDLTTTGDSIQVPVGSTITFSKKEVQGKKKINTPGVPYPPYVEPALSDFSRDISRVRWYAADLNEVDTTTIPSASMIQTGGSSGGSDSDLTYWVRVRALSWTKEFKDLGDITVKLRVDYTDGTFEEVSGKIRVIADSVTAGIAKTISNGGAVDSSSILTGKTAFLSAGSATSISGAFSKFEWDLDGNGTYEIDGGTTDTRSTAFTTSGSKTVGVRVTSRGGSTSTATTTIDVRKSPPSGEAGVSIIDGASFTNKKAVQLNLVWPEYATEARISNDGGFAASKTQTKDLAASIDWELDDSVKGIYPKVVYVRFNGVTDTTKTYSDDIILDTTAPVVESASAAAASGSIDVSLKATDDLTGVNKIQITNGTATVIKDYGTNVSVPIANLLLSVSSMGVQKLAATSLGVRVSDNAGNWSAYKALSVLGLVTTPTIAKPTVSKSKSATAKSIAIFAKIPVLSTSKVSLKVVSGYAKYCKVSGTTLKGIKAGICKATVRVTQKKGKVFQKTVTLEVGN